MTNGTFASVQAVQLDRKRRFPYNGIDAIFIVWQRTTLRPAHRGGGRVARTCPVDPRRFDSLTRAFSSRFSRRAAVRTGGVGVAAALAASAGIHSSRSVTAQTTAATSTPYSVLRIYTFDEEPTSAVQALTTGYLPQLQQQAGFLQYSVIVSEQNALTTISVFDTQANFTAASEALASWIEENLASELPDATDSTEGNAVIFALNTNVVCGTGPAPTTTPAATPTVPATPEACTGEGCACNGGVQNACDAGLVCCQSGESIPGGPGICTAEDACNEGAATPVA